MPDAGLGPEWQPDPLPEPSESARLARRELARRIIEARNSGGPPIEEVLGTGFDFEGILEEVIRLAQEITLLQDSPPPWLSDLLAALGWSDGTTIHQAILEVRRLRNEGPGKTR
jgi:hypothetical protein